MALSFWRAYGAFANSKVGRAVLDNDGGLISGATAAAMRINLEEEVPWTPLEKPVRECRVALVVTTGIHTAEQEPFDVDAALGDSSFRIIDNDVDPSTLQIAHTHYPHERADKDINVVFPLGRLREAAAAGGIGELAPRHVSFGFCAVTGALVKPPDGTAHQVAAMLRDDAVDLALLVPG